MTYLEFMLLVAALCLLIGAAEVAAVFGIVKLIQHIITEAKKGRSRK